METKSEIEILKSELKTQQRYVLELEAAMQVNQIELERLTKELAEVDDFVKLSKDEKIGLVLKALVDKLKKRHEEAAKLRLDNKISEYTFTSLTFGLELIYLAKEAYDLAIKDSHGLLELVPENEQDSNGN